MDRRRHPADGIDQEHRQAVGGLDDQGEPGGVGDEGVARRERIVAERRPALVQHRPRRRPRHPDHPGGVHLLQGRPIGPRRRPARRAAPPGAEAVSHRQIPKEC